ncbi:MAG: pyruvate kinase [Betaproteobacteria bacterium]|nr:pyruvate kinase [Betaproteobacteria bacterium]
MSLPPSNPGPERSTAWNAPDISSLIDALTALRSDLVATECAIRPRLQAVHPTHRSGAVNLVHYVALRQHDLRELQERLAWVGVSSLGRAESHVLANLDKVLGLLHVLAGRPWDARSGEEPAGYRTSARLLADHADALLGRCLDGRRTRIMVTLPSEAATDYGLVRGMMAAGMDCARINCAHDDAVAWECMILHVDRARRELGRPCKVLMDLAGPKLRTGALAPGPRVLKWRPVRDAFGRVTRPARVFLAPRDGAVVDGADACLHVEAAWLARLTEGAEIAFVDARGAHRRLVVRDPGPRGAWCDASQTAYVTPETLFRIARPSIEGASGETRPVGLPERPRDIVLHRGDTLVLTRETILGHAAEVDASGRVTAPASIPCTLPEVFTRVKPGERIRFDDGRIGGVIRKTSEHEVHVEITDAREGGDRLGADKGINLPDSELELPALTQKDRRDLAFVSRHADLVGLSFVNSPHDVEELQTLLAGTPAPVPGVVLKIERRSAFQKLPDILLTAMRCEGVGVMIARGDLGVELGFERLAEVQEEILWLAEAAHVPVVWATQVLEGLAKFGQPSRAEITDAAMGERAECVMLNKGPHVVEAIDALADILGRMAAHQHKKRSMLRKLHWWPQPSVPAPPPSNN